MEPIKKLSPEEYAKEIKAKYVNLYRNHLSKMSENTMREINKILYASKVTNKMKNLEEQFRHDLVDKNLREFNKIWSAMELPTNTARLKELINENPQKNVEKWRPTGKNVSDQIQYHKIAALKSKLNQFEDIIGEQQHSLTNVLVAVEAKRQFLATVTKRREKIEQNMQMKCDEITKNSADLIEKYANLENDYIE